MADVTALSSFGLDTTTLGADFPTLGFDESPRYRLLDRRQSYYSCTQHDAKTYDFDGRTIVNPGNVLVSPMIAEASNQGLVPLRDRRPSAPYRLPRVIADTFTNLIFGHQRWPTFRSEDPDTEEFIRALVDAQALRTVMVRARTLGGSTGTVGLSWRYWNGRPRTRVHNAKNLFVHTWADREMLIPAHVSEIYRFTRLEYDRDTRRMVDRPYWYRHDWTPAADVAFFEVPIDDTVNPQWQIDPARSYVHGDGEAHFVWIQNLPSDDISTIDGVPDYEGLYDTFDALDVLYSVLVHGTTLNLDPTLLLKVDPDLLERSGAVQKGSRAALNVGPAGDARYMELQGTAVTAGTALFMKMRESALEVAQCIIPDPNQVGASGTSSVALKVVNAPMLSKADVIREQYDHGMRQLLQQQLRGARRLEIGEESGLYLELPTRVEVQLQEDDDGITREVEVRVDQKPGGSDVVVTEWGDYYTPTATDQQLTSATLTQLTASKLLAQEVGADLAARVMRINARGNWAQLEVERRAAAERQQFELETGGAVEEPDAMPDGASGRGVAELLKATRGALPAALTVNELRELLGLPSRGEDGDVTLGEAVERVKRPQQPIEQGMPVDDGGGYGAEDDRAQPGDEPGQSAAEQLAADMTAASVERCEHGSVNRCRLCGIERERGFDLLPDGQPVWRVAWRAMRDG